VSQRGSGYERKALDQYETPSWVTEALLSHLPMIDGPSREPLFRVDGPIWEPACGSGKMAEVLRQVGFDVIGTDIVDGVDFLDCDPRACAAIITNPPYALAERFVERALDITYPHGFVAMLLRADFDSAAGRKHLFAGCPAFAKKVVLTRRVVWFERPGAAPSFNHAWLIWDFQHSGPPTLAYA
jgi:hypothetical protein